MDNRKNLLILGFHQFLQSKMPLRNLSLHILIILSSILKFFYRMMFAYYLLTRGFYEIFIFNYLTLIHL